MIRVSDHLRRFRYLRVAAANIGRVITIDGQERSAPSPRARRPPWAGLAARPFALGPTFGWAAAFVSLRARVRALRAALRAVLSWAIALTLGCAFKFPASLRITFSFKFFQYILLYFKCKFN